MRVKVPPSERHDLWGSLRLLVLPLPCGQTSDYHRYNRCHKTTENVQSKHGRPSLIFSYQ